MKKSLHGGPYPEIHWLLLGKISRGGEGEGELGRVGKGKLGEGEMGRIRKGSLGEGKKDLGEGGEGRTGWEVGEGGDHCSAVFWASPAEGRLILSSIL